MGHGKGGHKDSWDPLLIQSPPQITQRPVGIIQRPKAQNASIPTGPPVIERGVQIDNSNFMYGNYYNNSMVPVDSASAVIPQGQNYELQQEQLLSQSSNGSNHSHNLTKQIDHSLIQRNIDQQKEVMEKELREKEAEKQRKELELREQKQREQEERQRLENERKRQEELENIERGK